MNSTVLSFLARRLTLAVVRRRRVLEVGSFDVNGSPRSVVIPLRPAEYIGVDLTSGPGVDRVCDGSALVDAFGRCSFDIVISTEMLEHAPDWRAVVTQMKRVLRPNGTLVVTTRSPGFPYHAFPGDCWRFTSDDFTRMFGDMHIEEVCEDPAEPGVFGCFRKKWQTEVPLEDMTIQPAPRA